MSIYLDNSATTKICREALDKYVELSSECFGNPSSLHAMGHLAEKELDAARRILIDSLGAKGSEVVFCASGSEANNLAILGRAEAKERYKRGSRIITTDSEHASVSAPLDKLASLGYEIVKIPTRGGTLDLNALQNALTKNTILVTFMMVNNETGAVYDMQAASNLIHALAPEAIFHVDATQSYLKIPFTKRSIGADLITVSSHKIEGPKGVGALIIDPLVIKTRGIAPQILGGGQEKGYRSGTENVPGVAAFGKAIEVNYPALSKNREKLISLKEYLTKRIESDETLKAVSITKPTVSAPHIINITLPGIKSETMLHFLSSKGIFVSSGSACSSNSQHVSSALVAFGRTPDEADHSLRISLSPRNEISDIDALCEALCEGLSKLARVKR